MLIMISTELWLPRFSKVFQLPEGVGEAGSIALGSSLPRQGGNLLTNCVSSDAWLRFPVYLIWIPIDLCLVAPLHPCLTSARRSMGTPSQCLFRTDTQTQIYIYISLIYIEWCFCILPQAMDTLNKSYEINWNQSTPMSNQPKPSKHSQHIVEWIGAMREGGGGSIAPPPIWG